MLPQLSLNEPAGSTRRDKAWWGMNAYATATVSLLPQLSLDELTKYGRDMAMLYIGTARDRGQRVSTTE